MFIELTSMKTGSNRNKPEIGDKFLVDFNSGWEIYDKGNEPAFWTNGKLGMNYNVVDTYSQIKNKLAASSMLVDLESQSADITRFKEMERLVTVLIKERQTEESRQDVLFQLSDILRK